MKNIIIKKNFYKDIGYFSHVYFVDFVCNFNEKSIEEIVNYVTEEPFCDVMIHANNLNYDVIKVLKELAKVKDIWFETNNLLFEDFAVIEKDIMKVLGIDKIKIMIDALGDVIDFKKSIENEEFVKFEYMILPF